jgi:hypothetical protein
MLADAPEFGSKRALEIVRLYQHLDEETFDKETDENIPFNEDYTKENGYMSQRKDVYVVSNENDKTELKRALSRLFEGNSVHYKKRIVVE